MLMNPRRRPPSTIIAAVVSDVDGTLVTEDKSLPPRAQATVARLDANGIAFTIISSRPPRGLRMLIESLGITRPIAGFNGGVLSSPNLSVIEQHLLPPEVAQRAVHLITAHGAQSWVFSGQDWLVRDIFGSYVGLEEHTVRFPPTVVENFGSALFAAAKIVAVSEDFDLLTRLEQDARALLAAGATVARSQPYYVDFTHPLANKGAALTALAALLAIPAAEIAVIGDGDNDVAMFERSGLSIAMGNAGPQVQRAADFVTDRNSEDGFAKAIEWFILDGHRSNAAAPRPAAGSHNGVEAAGEGDLAW
jgi:Cof subfamily protein (haloacid dehalogenase superfamily)